MKKLAFMLVAALPIAASADGTRLKGYVGGRLDAMVERHVAACDVGYLVAPFADKTDRKYRWKTEFWGKYMHSAVPYARYSGSARLCESIERGIDGILASQEPSGYIGNYPDDIRCGEGWDVWGMKYTLMGLLHYYDWKPNDPRAARALEAARRLCDYIIGEIGPGGRRGCALWQTGNWSGYASSSILEPVVWLYRRTGEKKYMDFASYIVKGMVEPEKGPRLVDLALKGVSVADRNDPGYRTDVEWKYVSKFGRSKAYEMMSCYQGLLEYAETAMKEGVPSPVPPADILKAAVMTAEDIVREEINLAGGCASCEAWFHGAHKQHLPYERLHETCVTITWMRLCEKLLEMTGDPKWADELERTFYNAYLAAIGADGSEIAMYVPLSGNRWKGNDHCFMHTNCCTANGPRGFLCFLEKFFFVKDGVATFNFYSSAIVSGDLPGGRKAAFDVYSLYPRSGDVRILSRTEGPLALRLRIPGWCAKASVKVNGRQLDGVKSAYFTIDRTWKMGDVVELSFDMPVVAHAYGHHVAFTRGPVLLARDSRFADGDLSEPFLVGSVKDGQKMQSFVPVSVPSGDFWMAFSATLPIGWHPENPEARLPVTVSFCDYASAGNSWRRLDTYRTWLPIEYGHRE